MTSLLDRLLSTSLLVTTLVACAACAPPQPVGEESPSPAGDFTPTTSPQPLIPQATATPGAVWQSTNPGGGGAFATVGAGPSGVIIAASDLSGAYRSLDRGQSWDVIGSYRGLTSTHVSGIGFDPTDPAILYLGTDDGIFRSHDTGETVQQVLSGGYVTDIAVAASDPRLVYAAYHSEWDSDDGHIYRSDDGGLTWEPVSVDLPPGLRILKLIVSPRDADVVYLLSGEGRFASGPPAAFRSMDGGVHWEPISVAPGRVPGRVMDIALSRANPSTLYLTTYNIEPDLYGYLYRSEDGGETWEEVTHRAGIIWLHPADPRLIRLIDVGAQFPWDERNGVWESTDGGATWRQVSGVEDWDTGWSRAYFAYEASFNGDARTLGEDLSDPDALLWATGQWIFATFDGGRRFQNLFTDQVAPGRWRSRGLDNVVMFGFTVSEAAPDDIYLGYFDIGCWRSRDYGASWQNCNHPDYTGDWEGQGGNTTTLLADPSRAGVIWTAQAASWDEPGTLLRSSDGGETWEAVGAGLPPAPLMGLSLDRASPEDSRTLFLAAAGDVYVSHDDGYHWSRAFKCGGCRVTAVDRFDGALVYAGGERGLWRSTEGGAVGTWESVGLPEMSGEVSGEVWEWGWEGVISIEPDPHR
ncbi:MAG TPA: hypothetical protein ENI95_02785, partial [Chloroflexi bacterium]|nr:hypothetical protein [Chloroflexota bacterium]